MAIFVYTFIGLVIGAVSFVVMPATRLVGLVGSVLLGMAGGTLGGLIGTAIVPAAVLAQVSPMGIVLAVVGSLLVSVALLFVSRNRGIA